ncbi:hypothetical protein C8R46DRAFT_646555 [Mycena filopes]|nr:hypothetical protein C8R46DRAFT_646555 [Mycena filopes]
MLPFPFVAILASTAFVQAQTLYELARTDTLPATGLWEQELGSTALSAVGVGADGMTTYVRNVFVTAIGYSQSGSIFGLKPTTAEIDCACCIHRLLIVPRINQFSNNHFRGGCIKNPGWPDHWAGYPRSMHVWSKW